MGDTTTSFGKYTPLRIASLYSAAYQRCFCAASDSDDQDPRYCEGITGGSADLCHLISGAFATHRGLPARRSDSAVRVRSAWTGLAASPEHWKQGFSIRDREGGTLPELGVEDGDRRNLGISRPVTREVRSARASPGIFKVPLSAAIQACRSKSLNASRAPSA